ncbi:MAG: hypothetical protein NZ518_01190 [Dehalococcoidia bacterium]|nr:hypothetical protein [Dehalococcoidia bacterium]
MGRRQLRGTLLLSGLTLAALAALFVTLNTVVPVLDHWPLTVAYGALATLVSATLLALAPRAARRSVLAIVGATALSIGAAHYALDLPVAAARHAESGDVVVVAPKWRALVSTRETVPTDTIALATDDASCHDTTKPLGVTAPILSLLD